MSSERAHTTRKTKNSKALPKIIWGATTIVIKPECKVKWHKKCNICIWKINITLTFESSAANDFASKYLKITYYKGFRYCAHGTINLLCNYLKTYHIYKDNTLYMLYILFAQESQIFAAQVGLHCIQQPN